MEIQWMRKLIIGLNNEINGTIEFYKHSLANINPMCHILDLGGGKGYLRKVLTNQKNIIGLDLKKMKGVDVIGDGHFLPFKDNVFDVIICSEVLEHAYSPQQFISEIKRTLKPIGKLFLSTRFIFPIHGAPQDYYRFTEYGLQYLLRDFNRINIEPHRSTLGTFITIIWNLKRKTFMERCLILVFCSLLVLLDKLRLFPDKNDYIRSGYFVTATKKE